MIDRAHMAVTKWLPLSSVCAGISFVAGLVSHLAPTQILVSTAIAATLVFSGFAFQSFGKAS